MGTIEKELTFYKIMDYPVPKQKEFFYFEKKIEKKQKIENWFSRDNKNQFIDNFIKKINKHWKLYKSLPFVQEIFLCNSISFNSLKRDSDIDLFIITKKNNIWRARLFSAIFFKLLWIKRSMKNKKQKFCLSFYITEDYKNLYPIMLEKTDIYLAYRIAHLVPLYQESKQNETLYTKNQRFKELLPNHPQKYCINIWNQIFIWKTKIKKTIEFIFSGIFGHLIEKMIKFIRIPILTKKINKLWDKKKLIVINDKMLKFHDDIREQIHLLYKIANKK
jgi:hypothetical protein